MRLKKNQSQVQELLDIVSRQNLSRVENGAILSLAKIEKAFEMDDIQRDSVTCYMDENHGVAEFWRTTGAIQSSEKAFPPSSVAPKLMEF